ncbi:hypothetical protein Purlil1_13707 [Purpureocillium lilacinum]|uniref:Uncharacterized protein n=1 Tax=Purpureocillium lilacinum TaxID=33203 RepID=A0ABR0BDB8_PURLI|nr:hypothetical protein Purlil1_13707 [Purpureocillium lilacinum]
MHLHGIMEDVIRLVISKKVGEALALLGVGDYSQESIKEHVLSLSDSVRDAMLKAGKETTPACLSKEICCNRQAAIDAPLLGSYRILSNSAKRGQTDYKGLDGPARKKRSRGGRVKKHPAASVPPDGTTSNNGRDSTANENDQPSETTECGTAAAAANRSDQSEEPPEADVNAADDKDHNQPSEAPQNDGDTTAANRDDRPSDCPETDIASTRANDNDQLNKASENDIATATAENNDRPSEAAKNEVETGAGKENNNQCNEHNPGRDPPNDGPDGTDSNAVAQPHDEIQQIAVISSANNATDLDKTSALDDDTPPDESQQSVTIAHATGAQARIATDSALVSNTDYCVSFEPPTETIQDLFASASAREAMETIVVSCATLNYTLGSHSWSSTTSARTAKTSDVRNYAEQILSWDFERALQALRNERATLAIKDIQDRYMKSIYWRIITKYAASLDPSTLKTAKGPLDDFTMAEKKATEDFMKNARIGLSPANQRRCRRFWKSLSDMREAGVENLLFYRTKEFDSFCDNNNKGDGSGLVQTVLSWEKVYGPHLEHLAERAKKEAGGDRTGRLWLAQPHVAKRLHVREACWNDARNVWGCAEEEEQFASIPRQTNATADLLGGLLDIPTAAGGNRNKSIFVSLFSRGEEFLSVHPIITIQEGDFLGIFAGTIRYSKKFNPLYGIRGPADKLWLDHSCVTGLLNQMRVTPSHDQANVDLRWELVEDSKSKARWELVDDSESKDCPLTWRLSVRALRTIKPFEELVRAANSVQCLIHRKPAHARLGFMRPSDAPEQEQTNDRPDIAQG